MAEEFADFMTELNQKSLKEQVEELQKVISGFVDITEKFINYYDMELSIIHNKIIKLETNQMKSKLPKIKVLSAQPPPPPPQQRPIGDERVRTSVIGELKNLFKINGDEKK